MADKKETGGLLGAEDIQSSAINTIPNQANYLNDIELLTGGRRANLNSPATQTIALDAATFLQTEQDYASPSVVQPGEAISPGAAPELYKTIYQSAAENGINSLANTLTTFGIDGQKNRLARLNYQIATIEEGKYQIDLLLDKGRIDADKHKELSDQLTSGQYSQLDQAGDLFEDVFQIEGADITAEDVSRAKYLANEYKLLNGFMDKVYEKDNVLTYEDMLEEKNSLAQTVADREADPGRPISEDFTLKAEISEDSGTTLLNNPAEYFKYQAATDIAGTLSTMEGWVYSLGGPAIVRTIQKRLPKVVAKAGIPGKIAAGILSMGSIAYGTGLSRYMETSMETGGAYWDKVDQLEKELIQNKADNGLPQVISESEKRKIAIDAYRGIETLKNKNYKLGTGDVAQFLLTFGSRGKANNMFGLKPLGRAIKSRNLGKLGTNLASFTGRIAASREIEGTEEGLQFKWNQDYNAGVNARQTGFIEDYTEYWGDRTGIKPGNPDLYQNLGFKHAQQSGFDMATMMTGSGRAMHGILDLYNYRKAIGSLQGGEKIDKDNMHKVESDVILNAYKKGGLENLRLAILKAGRSDKYEGIDQSEAKDIVERIDKAEILLDEIYNPKSAIGFSLAGFDVDPIREAALEGQKGFFGFGKDSAGIKAYNINKDQAFFNAMEIVSKEERLTELEQLQSDYKADQDNSANSLFGLEDLSINEKKIVEKKLKDRGVNTTPYDLEIEELKNDIGGLKTDNRQVATGDYVHSGAGYMTMDEFRRGSQIQKRIIELQSKETKTPADQAELQDLVTEIEKINYTSTLEYSNLKNNFNQANIKRATAADFIARTLSMLETDAKKHLPTILSAMLEKGMKLDESTLEMVAAASDNITEQRNKIQAQLEKNSSTISNIINGYEDSTGKAPENMGQAFDPMDELSESRLLELRSREASLTRDEVQELGDLVERAAKTDRIDELQKQNIELTNEMSSISDTANLADKVFARGVQERFLKSDEDFKIKSSNEIIESTAKEDLIENADYINSQLSSNPDYADVNSVQRLVNEIDKRIRIFRRRAVEAQSQDMKDFYSKIADELQILQGIATEQLAVAQENKASRTASQVEFEGQMAENLLNSIGIDKNFQFFTEGPFQALSNIIKPIISVEDFVKVRNAVAGDSPTMTDKVMAAMVLINIVKERAATDQVFASELTEALAELKGKTTESIKEQSKDSTIDYSDTYLSNPTTTFDTYELPYIADAYDILDKNSPIYKYKDHKNLSKLLKDLKADTRPEETTVPDGEMPELSVEASDGVTRISNEELIKLVENQLTLKRLAMLDMMLKSEHTATDQISQESFIGENPNTAPFKPTKQQLHAARELAFFLGLPEIDITAETSIGDFAAVLQGAAGTGKTKVVLQLASLFSGLGTGSIMTIGHNDSSSKTISNALNTEENNVTTFLDKINSTEGFPAHINLLVIDEAFGMTVDQMQAVDNAVVKINNDRKTNSLSQLKVIMLGDPGQMTAENVSVLQVLDIDSKINTVVTPVSTVYRSDIPALIDFQNVFRRNVEDVSNRPIVSKVTNLNIGVFNETTNPIKGVYGVSGDFKQGILARLSKLDNSGDGKRRVIITDPTRVEDYKAYTQGNGFDNIEVLSYLEAQGQTIEEVYMDILGLDVNGDKMSPAKHNDAMYTASSRAVDLIVAANLNIENTVDPNLDRVSAGLSQEITERNEEFMRETRENAELIKQFENLEASENTKQDIAEKDKEITDVPDNREALKEELDQEVDDINIEADPIEPSSETTIPVDNFESDKEIGLDNTIEDVSEDRNDILNFPEYDATTESQEVEINGQTYTVLPAQENKPVFIVASKVGKKTGAVVYQAAYNVDGSIIPGAYRKIAVLDQNDIDNASWLSSQEKQNITKRIQEGRGARLEGYTVPGDKSILINSQPIQQSSLVKGLIIPEGGVRKLTYKYKSREEIDKTDASTQYAPKRGLIDTLLERFVTRFYSNTSKRPSAKSLRDRSVLRIFRTQKEVAEYQSKIGNNFIIKRGVPYIILEDVVTNKNKTSRVQIIPLVPRRLRKSNKDDNRMYYEPVQKFTNLVGKVEEITGLTYGTKEFRDFLLSGNSNLYSQLAQASSIEEKFLMGLLDDLLLGVYAEVVRAEDGSLLRDSEGKLEAPQTGPGYAQKVLNTLAKSNGKREGFDGFRVVQKFEGKKVVKAKGLLAVYDPQRDGANGYKYFNKEKLETLMSDNEEGINNVLYVPIIYNKVTKGGKLSDPAVKQFIDTHFQDPTDEIYNTQIAITKGEAAVQLPAVQEPVEEKKTPKAKKSNRKKRRNNFKLFEDSDKFKDKKGKLVSKVDALKELKRILPDAFRKDGSLKPEYIAFINGVDMLQLTETPGAIGTFMNDMIFVIEQKGGIYKNVVRHEVFHKIFSYFLTDAERKELLKSARQTYPETSKMSDLQVEEFLADKFMDYSLKKPLTMSDKVRAFFKKVLKFFGIVRKDTDNITKFFNNVEEGYFSGFKGEPLDSATPKNYVQILKEYGNTDTFRAAKHLLTNGLAEYLDMTNESSVVEGDAVSNVFFNRDERFAFFKEEYLQEEIADLEDIQDRSPAEDALLKAAKILQDDKIANALYKDMYSASAEKYELEEKTESMQDQIIEAYEINHQNNLTSEVRDFLNNITYTKADGTVATVSQKFSYFVALQLLSGQDTMASSADFIQALTKRQTDLGYRPGTPGHAVVESIKNIVQTSLTSDFNTTVDGILETVEYPKNVKFDTDKTGNEVFIYHPTKDVSGVDVSIDNLNGFTIIKRTPKQTSGRFLKQALDAQQDAPLSVMKPLYKQFYQKNVFFNLFVNTGSLRKEKFHLGDYSRSTETNEAGVSETVIKTRYYQHKEFGTQAARETAISENIYDNFKGLVKNRGKIAQLVKDGKVEQAYLEMLSSIGLPYIGNTAVVDKSNLDALGTAIINVVENVYAATNKRKRIYDEFGEVVTYTRNNKAKGEVKGKPVRVPASPQEALEDSKGFIKTLASSIITLDQNKKAGSIRTATGKNVYTYHNSSFGLDALLGLIGQAPKKAIYSESNNPVWTKLFKFNPFTNGSSKIYDIADHDAYADRKGKRSPVTMNLEKPKEWFERNFIYQFASGMQNEVDELSYIQQMHTVADTTRVRNARVKVLSRAEVKSQLIALYNQYKERGATPIVFAESFKSSKTAGEFASKAFKTLNARTKKFEKFLTDNGIDNKYSSIGRAQAMLKEQGIVEGKGNFKNAQEAFVYNYALNSTFLNQIAMGDTSSLGDSFKVIKRMKVSQAPGYKGFVNEQYGMSERFNMAISQDPKANPFEYMDAEERARFKDQLSIMGIQFDIADAQGYMLPERRADIKKGFGNGLNIGNVLKPVYYGIHEDGNAVAVKYSSIVLTNDLVERFPSLGQLRTAMRVAGVGEYVMDSGIKNGAPATDQQATTGYNFQTGQTDFNIPGSSILELYNENFRIQLDPESKIDTLVSNPTQMAYFINSNGNNRSESIEYYDLMSKLFEEGISETHRDLGIKDNKKNYTKSERTKLKNKIQTKIAKIAASRENSQREAMMLESGGIDINFPAIAGKSMSLLSSFFNNAIVRPKFPGQKLALMSDLGITVFAKGNKVGTRTELESQGIEIDNTWTERGLRHMYGNNGYAEVILPEALRGQFLIGDEFYNKYGMGFRIPSTELHSAIPLKVVGFSNEAGTSTIIAPKELSPLHGSDFDIDSLFIVRRATPVDFSNRIQESQFVRFNLADVLANTTVEAVDLVRQERDAAELGDRKNDLNKIYKAVIKNRMLQIYLDVITKPENRESMLTPINLKVLNGLNVDSVFDMYAKESKVNVPKGDKNYKNSSFYQGRDLSDPFDEMYMHQSNQQGAKLTGIFANSMKAISYLMGDDAVQDVEPRTGAKVVTRTVGTDEKAGQVTDVTYTIDGKEYGEFRRKDTDGAVANVALDALVNAAIDNANEQILNILGLNNQTAGYAALMIAQGVPLKTASAVVGQPAIREAFERPGNFKSNLQNVRRELLEDLDAGTVERFNEAVTEKGLAMKELLSGISRYEDRSKEFAKYSQSKKLEQAAVIGLLLEMSPASNRLVDVSQALSIVQSMPNGLGALESKVEEWSKLFIDNGDGTFENVDTILDSSMLMNHKHIRSAYKALNILNDAHKAAFHLANPRLQEYLTAFEDLRLAALENKKDAEIEVRQQFLKYLTSSLVDTSEEAAVTVKNDAGTKFTLRGNRAFIHKSSKRIQELQNSTNSSGERLGDVHPFLSNITVERDRFNNRYFKSSDTKKPTQEELVDIHTSFNKLSIEDQEMVIKYATINEGLEFGAGNITLLLPPNVLTDISKRREQLLGRLLNTGEKIQSPQSQQVLSDLKEHFEIQYALNNPGRIREHFMIGRDEDGNYQKPIKRGDSVYGTTVENGIVTDYAVPGGGHPKFFMNNNVGVLYIKAHEVSDQEGNVMKTLYQQVGTASSAVSAFSLPQEFTNAGAIKDGYQSNKYFDPMLIARSVDNISQKELTLRKDITDQDGNSVLKPGLIMIVKLPGDSTRVNAKRRTVESVTKTKDGGINITFKPGSRNITRLTAEQRKKEQKTIIDNTCKSS